MWLFIYLVLFVCVDGMGRLDLWNFNNDIEVLIVSIFVEGNFVFNCVRWIYFGREIVVGDFEGQIVIYDVGEQIVVFCNDEWVWFG